MPSPSPNCAPEKESARGRILSRNEIETLIAKGKHVFILQNRVIQVDCWLDYHPGGQLAIKHCIGRDATDEVTVLHSESTLTRMKDYQIGVIEGSWSNFVPPIQGGQFRDRSDEDPPAKVAIQPPALLATPQMDLLALPIPSNYHSPSVVSSSGTECSSILRSRGLSRSPSMITPASSVVEEETDVFETKETMGTIDIKSGKVYEIDSYEYPSPLPQVQEPIVQKYRQLHEALKKEGLFQTNYGAYMVEVTRYTLFLSLCIYLLSCGWYKTSAIFLGIFWHQLVFTAHDAGHMGITHDYHKDTLIGIFIADFLGGLSIGWWKRSHNVHHIVTNSPEHDSDIQHLPFFAISTRFFQSLRSTYYDAVIPYDAAAKFLVPYQNFLYHFVLLFGRFNLYALSWSYLWKGPHPKKGLARFHRYYEIAGMIGFWYWFGYSMLYKSIPTNWDRFWFIMISHVVTAPLHVQITLSHFAMSTSELGPDESFAQRMLRTTMDVECPEWLDFFHGGLQFQAIHHLYPRMPRHNLRRAQKLVLEFCKEVNIPYALYGFVDGNKAVLGRLQEVGRQASILAKCQQSLASSDDFGLH